MGRDLGEAQGLGLGGFRAFSGFVGFRVRVPERRTVALKCKFTALEFELWCFRV